MIRHYRFFGLASFEQPRGRDELPTSGCGLRWTPKP